jgi:glutathione S-transferase
MLRLHDHGTSGNGYKARLLLRQLDVPFQRIEYDIDKAETRTPAFLAMNPNGRVPVLELEDGRCLPESNAIMWYLAEGTPFAPRDRWERADALHWMFFEQYNHEPNIATVRYWLTHGVEMTEERLINLPIKRKLGYAALDVMEAHLSGARAFFVGERYTIVDIALYAYTHVAPAGGFELAGYPAIQRWLAAVAAQPKHVPITFL